MHHCDDGYCVDVSFHTFLSLVPVTHLTQTSIRCPRQSLRGGSRGDSKQWTDSVISVVIMGGSSSKKIDDPSIDESSSGIHLIEVHSQSWGMGFGTLFLLVLCFVFGWLFYKKCCHVRQNTQLFPMNNSTLPFGNAGFGGMNAFPVNFQQQPQQPSISYNAVTQMLTDAVSNALPRINARNLGLSADSELHVNQPSFIDQLDNLHRTDTNTGQESA